MGNKYGYNDFQQEHLELLRMKMMETARTHGFHHPLVLYYSHEVDQEHNRMLGLQYHEKRFPSTIYPTRKYWQVV
ncbi:hypothetical protein [Salibacterium lacus]|uniref:Aspartyl-phosphate phosphatase Spo0E family protein n=1 Tax=Salibacterium lacus TaxID=1898109 RepID=A0ABW5T1K8_9BACI